LTVQIRTKTPTYEVGGVVDINSTPSTLIWGVLYTTDPRFPDCVKSGISRFL